MTLDYERFTLLTFDCYGTLIDWEQGILGAIRPVFHEHGIEADDEEILEAYALCEAKQEAGDYIRYEIVLSMVMAELSLRFGFDATPQEVKSLAGSIKNWQPFPDTIEALRKLKTKYKLAIVSNIDDSLFEATAKTLEVPFDWVVTAQQAGAYKPALRTFEYAFDTFQIPREQILHVAQSIYHDIVPARGLGVASAWVNRRHGREGSGATRPAHARPDVEVKSLLELTEQMGL